MAGLEGTGPAHWCAKEIACPVAITPMPSDYFFWLMQEVFPLKTAGYRIENEWLTLEQWLDLGTLCQLMDYNQQSEQASGIRDGLLMATTQLAAHLTRRT